MTLFQLILFFISATVFYLFFKQLFGGNYPKRGVDFEADLPSEQIGGITNPAKTFSQPEIPIDRISELKNIADKAASENDWLEVKKAMQSAIIIDEKNVDALHRLGTAYLQMNDHANAKETYEKILTIEADDDLAEASLANALHKLGEDDAAIVHHERSIVLDGSYAPHYYNYANTLYDMSQETKALELYKKALEIDPEMTEATKAIEELGR